MNPNPDRYVDNTRIFFMDLQNPDSFITINNAGNRGSQRQSRAMEWVYTERVGVVIASNIGRPGGACTQENSMSGFFFQQHPDARTQEESVLTFIRSIVTKYNHKNYLDKQLGVLSNLFGMRFPTGNHRTDFMVNDRQKHTQFNVRTSCEPLDYDREFGSSISVTDPISKVNHNIYLSFIAGPNASTPPYDNWTARRGKIKNGVLKFDTMFRTISQPARRDYGLFKRMILSALMASFLKMSSLQLKRVIMAAPSSGIYAGEYRQTIQAEYHWLCIEALETVYKSTQHRFSDVIIPMF